MCSSSFCPLSSDQSPTVATDSASTLEGCVFVLVEGSSAITSVLFVSGSVISPVSWTSSADSSAIKYSFVAGSSFFLGRSIVKPAAPIAITRTPTRTPNTIFRLLLLSGICTGCPYVCGGVPPDQINPSLSSLIVWILSVPLTASPLSSVSSCTALIRTPIPDGGTRLTPS